MRTYINMKNMQKNSYKNSNGTYPDGTWICKCYEEGWVDALEWVLKEPGDK